MAQSFSTPVGMLTAVNTAAAIGGFVWISRVKTDLSKDIEATNQTILKIGEYIRQFDPKSLNRLQHLTEELKANIVNLSTTSQEMADRFEEQESRLEALESNMEKVATYLETKDDQAQLDLESRVSPVRRRRGSRRVAFVQSSKPRRDPIPEPLPVPSSAQNDADAIDAVAAAARVSS